MIERTRGTEWRSGTAVSERELGFGNKNKYIVLTKVNKKSKIKN